MKKLTTAGGPGRLAPSKDDLTAAQRGSKGTMTARVPSMRNTGVARKRKANNSCK